MDSVYGHTVLHNDPVVAAEMRLVKNATSSMRGSNKRAATPAMSGDGPRCTAVTKKGTRCRNASTNFGDSKLCYIHSRQAMGKSEMADIRDYRAENPASGPGMYRDALNQWVVDDSIRLEAGADADDAIEL